MNKDQLARLARHSKVKQVLTDNASAVAAVPAFAKLAAKYLTQLGLLDGTAQRNPVTSQGATLAKTTAGTALIARLMKAANALYLLYKAEQPANLTEAAKLHRHASDYTALSDQELATEAHALSQRATANQALLLSDYNLTTASIQALADDAQSFSTLLPSPQLAIDAAKIKEATARTTLSALNVFLRDDLRAGMELLKDTHEEAYKALREASQVDDARYRKGKKKGSFDTANLKVASLPVSEPLMAIRGANDTNAVHVSGIKSVYLVLPGGAVQLELTVSTDCIWDFVLPSFPVPVHQSQPPYEDAHRPALAVGMPADLIGKPCAWTLRLTNEADHSLPYHVEVYLWQDAVKVYAYETDGEIDPAGGVLDAFLGETLLYRK